MNLQFFFFFYCETHIVLPCSIFVFYIVLPFIIFVFYIVLLFSIFVFYIVLLLASIFSS